MVLGVKNDEKKESERKNTRHIDTKKKRVYSVLIKNKQCYRNLFKRFNKK